MKTLLLFIFSHLLITPLVYAQSIAIDSKQRKAIENVIDHYSQAREKNDTVLLKSILSPDVDQLVSTGEWRDGIQGSMKGMLRSSENNPGTRILIVEKVRLITTTSGIADARYEIKNQDGTVRKMWSTFILVYQHNQWKISAIRNMLPTQP
jgi:ketosteroid isomerase-like protein